MGWRSTECDPKFGQELNRSNLSLLKTNPAIDFQLPRLCVFFYDGSSLNKDVQSVHGSFDNTRKRLNKVYICRAQEPVTFYWG